MRLGLAGPADTADLAHLLWLNASEQERAAQSVEDLAVDLAAWWDAGTHLAVVARVGAEAVGMAWVALVQRPPRPGSVRRLSADLQSVYVVPEHRGGGIGSSLVEAAVQCATRLGAARVTVHSGRRAVPVYERLGFSPSQQLLQLPSD